jgi:hypothetical protein
MHKNESFISMREKNPLHTNPKEKETKINYKVI